MATNVYLVLNNEMTLDGEAGYAREKLWLYIKGKTIEEICSFIFRPGITDRIEFHYGSLRTVYVDFTKVDSIIDDEGLISVRLSGGTKIEEDEPDERDVVDDGSDVVSGGEGSQSGDISPE